MRAKHASITVDGSERWDLSELLLTASEEDLARQLDALEKEVVKFEALRTDLAAGMPEEHLFRVLGEYEQLQEQMLVLGAYASLWFATDTQSDAALAFKNRVENELAAFRNRTLFFPLWWTELPASEADELLAEVDREKDFAHFLRDLRRLKPFTLDEASERLINQKDANGIQGVLTLYSMLSNRLEFHLEVDGERRVLARDELVGFVKSPRKELRQAAYSELLRVYEREAGIFSQIYFSRVRDWYGEKVELRKFPSPLSVRNVANDLPDAAVEALLAVVEESTEIFRRYFRLKASGLGEKRLSRYDLYAPLSTSETKVPYGDAVSRVLDTFHDFHPRVGEAAGRVFVDRHIDSGVYPGKKGGAFCATVLPRQTPWVLMNYTGEVRAVATLAHELGHAVHSILAADHSVLTQHPPLPLAETASVFAEMLVTERIAREEPDRLVRRDLLAHALDDIYATVMRQAYFTRFEIAAHESIRAGCSQQDLGDLYLSTLHEQFGDSVDVAPDFRYEWVGVPHIFDWPFYCYSYCFGQLLALALFQRFRQEGRDFIPDFLRLLAHGGAERPETILSEVGVEMRETDFWRGGFEVVSGMVDEIESTS